ncbi:unnamed protein product [Auanema sp. JU1783]|nr:unnamed protein product [Auanema sp. JU1783]
MTKIYAVIALHCIPNEFREIGTKVVLCDGNGLDNHCHIHGINTKSNYVVFKKDEGEFSNVPHIVYPMLSDQYIAVGFSFEEKTHSVCIGNIRSFSNGGEGMFYGDSGELTGFKGGGVFYMKSGALMGIARGRDLDGRDTQRYRDELEVISAQVIGGHIEIFDDKPFSV